MKTASRDRDKTDERGVTSPLSVVLILGISIATIGVTIAVGAAVVDEAVNDAERNQVENSLSQFSSTASLVALEDTPAKRFSLGDVTRGQIEVREDAGRVRLSLEADNETTELYEDTLGAVVYRNGDTEVAYQGGGVWKRSGEWSQMVSPPEYHYRGQTLTFPIVRVTGDDRASGSVSGTISRTVSDVPIYPNATAGHRNPLENGTVLVEIESDYCTGWQTFFQDRSDGELESTCEEGDLDTVVVDLTVVLDESFEHVLSANSFSGSQNPPPNSREGFTAPSASSKIDDRIEQCAESNCVELSEPPATVTNGTYTATDDSFEDVTFDTTDGPIEVVIEEDVTSVGKINVTGDHDVTVYLKGSFSMGGGDTINTGGDASQFRTLIHTDGGDIDFNGNFQYTGVLYAPSAEARFNGGGAYDENIIGSVTVDEATINGDPNNFEWDTGLQDVKVVLVADQNLLQYLHVTENTIDVRLD